MTHQIPAVESALVAKNSAKSKQLSADVEAFLAAGGQIKTDKTVFVRPVEISWRTLPPKPHHEDNKLNTPNKTEIQSINDPKLSIADIVEQCLLAHPEGIARDDLCTSTKLTLSQMKGGLKTIRDTRFKVELITMPDGRSGLCAHPSETVDKPTKKTTKTSTTKDSTPVNVSKVTLQILKDKFSNSGTIEPLTPLEQYAYNQATCAIEIESETSFKCSMSWSDGKSKIQLDNCIDPILVEAVLDYIHEHQGSAA